MAGNFYSNNNDSMDIKELADLNEDISDDFIAQLQQQLTGNVPADSTTDDASLFEEVKTEQPAETAEVSESNTSPIETPDSPKEATENKASNVNINFDDNFIKKYKAKLNKKAQAKAEKEALNPTSAEANENEPKEEEKEEKIENLSKGNISERPLTQELKDYNDSLDFLDGNVKYSKYVIYIDPQNVDFIEGLTVKERKNLINGILRQQDDIAITKQRFKIMQTVIRHVIVTILTIAITIPIVYYAINASLEATIDNHRRSQSNWQTLYKEHGKITPH